MRLSDEEAHFLRHWMRDEVHYQDGQGPAKRLQLLHYAIPADLAMLIATAIPIQRTKRQRASPRHQPSLWLGPGRRRDFARE
jgi:hypothetical protein